MSEPIAPVLSRRTVNPSMARRGMRSAAELAQGKPCGTRVRYYAGCRCDECRRANTEYERERQAARARGERNGLVSAERARAHLAWLSSQGIGYKTAADAAKVASSVVSMIIYGQRQQIREQTERRILGVTSVTAADGAYIDGGPTWMLLDELLASGYSRARIASEIAGRPLRALQLGRERVTVRSAELARQVHARLQLAAPADQRRAQALLAELREEGYRLLSIQLEVDELAAARGWASPSINPQPKPARWPQPAGLTQRATVLIEVVYGQLCEELAP